MSDDLDSLSDQELSERFATEVAGWKLLHWEDRKGNPCRGWMDAAKVQCRPLTEYATDANAVMPWLSVHDWSISETTNGMMKRQFECKLRDQLTFAPTFARAACIALLRSKR